MASGDSPQLSLGESPQDVLNGTINYLSGGGKLSKLLQGAIFGIFIQVATGAINFVSSVFALVVSPIDTLATIIPTFFDATVIEPLGVIIAGAQASASGVAAQFGVFALPVGVVIVLAAFYIISQYLQQPDTGDTVFIPGFPDIPGIGPFDVGVTEDGEEDEGE